MVWPLVLGGVAWIAGKLATKVLDNSLVREQMKNNPPTNTERKLNEVCEGQNQKLKEMQAKLDGMGGSGGEDIQKKVEEAVTKKLGGEPMTPREKQELIRQVPRMSEAEKEELRQKLKMENDAYHEAINKELKEKLAKVDKKATQLAQELKDVDGNPTKIAKVAAMMKENDKRSHAIKLEFKKQQEAKEKFEKEMKELMEVQAKGGKHWMLDMNFKSPWLYLVLLVFIILCYFMFKATMWCWYKVKGMFSGD